MSQMPRFKSGSFVFLGLELIKISFLSAIEPQLHLYHTVFSLENQCEIVIHHSVYIVIVHLALLSCVPSPCGQLELVRLEPGSTSGNSVTNVEVTRPSPAHHHPL